MGLIVGLMFNLGKTSQLQAGDPVDAHAELDSEETISAVAAALESAGHKVVRIEGNEDAYSKLRQTPLDIVFNMCEGVSGDARESQVPAMLEMLGIPYTGSGVLSLALTLDKVAAKKMFRYHGVATPDYRTYEPGGRIEWGGMEFPVFVKPVGEGSSMGVSPQSKVKSLVELSKQVRLIHENYHQAALVEEFIDGREFTVGLVGNEPPFILPIMEINFEAVPRDHGNIYSYQFKKDWDDDQYYLCPAPVGPALERSIKQAAWMAAQAVGCLDVARVDIRLGSGDVPYVLEVNPLPGLRPGFSDLCRQAEQAGWTYEELVNRILNAAVSRYEAAGRRVGSK